ncbi:g5436 [Coccomyxa elongata]
MDICILKVHFYNKRKSCAYLVLNERGFFSELATPNKEHCSSSSSMRHHGRQPFDLCLVVIAVLTALRPISAFCPDRPDQDTCFAKALGTALEATWGLHSQYIRHACGRKLAPTECTTLVTNRIYCLERFTAEAIDNIGCRRELSLLYKWHKQWETLAAETHLYCNTNQMAVQSGWAGDCQQMIRRLAEPMPEDWGSEEELRVSCNPLKGSSCVNTLSGQGRLNTCLRQSSFEGCTIPPIGGTSSADFNPNKGACKVAVISTYPPKNCGIATFTAALLARLRAHAKLPASCEIGVIAISEWSDRLLYTDPIVHYDLRVEAAMPSRSMLEAVHFIHKAGYTHVIIQQEFGLTPVMWQLADVARWLDSRIHVLTVVHSPRATPNLEEQGLLRAMSEVSERLIVMNWYGWHSLIAAYGISPDKIVFIPHGVNIPQNNALSERHLTALDQDRIEHTVQVEELLARAGVTSNSRILLSNGLVNQAKRLDRVLHAFPKVLEKFPETFFIILGREHPTEPLAGKLMTNLMRQATALGLKDKVIWLDEFVPTDKIMDMIKCTTIYLTPFDENTPTSGTLLMAMANGMPIVTTPFHFALELMQDSRGIVIPYEDQNGTLFATALSALLEDAPLRKEMGARAKAHVESWDWNKVAGQYAALIRGDSFKSLTADPFAETATVVATAKWNGSSIALPNGKTLEYPFPAPYSAIIMGAYAIYIDNDIQVNGAINSKGELFGVGVTSQHYWLLVNAKISIDYEWNPITVRQGHLGDWGLEIDMDTLNVLIRSQCAAINIHLTINGLIDLKIDITNRFASPKGLLGKQYHNAMDVSQNTVPLNSDDWEQWHVPNNFMLSTESQGQMWGHQFSSSINSNVMWLPENSLPRNRFDTKLENAASPILFILEGPVFGTSGIAQVNRRYWLQLSRTFETARGPQKFLVMLDPQEPLKSGTPMELDAFAQSGVYSDKITVLKHGVEFGKFNVSALPLPLPTQKGFRFLFNGGLLPRKGIDVVIRAYTSAFNADDNVALIIHSVYGDNYQTPPSVISSHVVT